MIRDVDLVFADGCPPEISRLADKPWNFCGEVKGSYVGAPAVCVICQCCSKPSASYWSADVPVSTENMFRQVDLRGYKFITDDMLIIHVYVGQCSRCQSVYWMRQGPPFCRATWKAYNPVRM